MQYPEVQQLNYCTGEEETHHLSLFNVYGLITVKNGIGENRIPQTALEETTTQQLRALLCNRKQIVKSVVLLPSCRKCQSPQRV